MFSSPNESDPFNLFGECKADYRVVAPAPVLDENAFISVFASFKIYNLGRDSSLESDIIFRATGNSLKAFYEGDLSNDSPSYLDVEKIIGKPLLAYENERKIFAVDVTLDTTFEGGVKNTDLEGGVKNTDLEGITTVQQVFHVAFLEERVSEEQQSSLTLSICDSLEECEKGVIKIISHSYASKKKSFQRIIKFEIASRENTFYGVVIVDRVMSGSVESLRWKYLYSTKEKTEEIFQAYLSHESEE